MSLKGRLPQKFQSKSTLSCETVQIHSLFRKGFIKKPKPKSNFNRNRKIEILCDGFRKTDLDIDLIANAFRGHLAPADIQSACTYKDKHGKKQKPAWKDATNGKKYFPSYNIAPGAHTPVLLSSCHFNDSKNTTSRVIQPMLWGLVPSWHRGSIRDKTYETNNCRAESMMEKQTYKVPLLKGRRCVVLAEGFFEWKRDKTAKQPYYIYFPKQPKVDISTRVKSESDMTSDLNEAIVQSENGNNLYKMAEVKTEDLTTRVKAEPLEESENDGKPEFKIETEVSNNKTFTDEAHSLEDEGTIPALLTMAGVFDVWHPDDGSEPVYSYSVITVESSSAMAWLHHRMPAILSSDEEIEEWLNYGEVPISKAIKLIQPSSNIELYPVSTYVNNARNNSPECIKKIDPSKPKQSGSSNIMKAWLAKGSSPVKTESSGLDRSKKESQKKAGSNLMMAWLVKGKSPIKTEPPDCKKMKFS